MSFFGRWRRFRSWALPALVGIVALLVTFAALGEGGFLPLPNQTPTSPTSDPGSTPSVGSSSGTPAPHAMATPTPQPKGSIKLDQDTVKQYGHIKLSADGLSPNEEVLVAVLPDGDGQPIELGRGNTDGQGQVTSFEADLPDAVTSGVRKLTVTGLSSHEQVTTTLNVRSEKLFAVLNSYTPRPTDKLGFVTGGFAPNSDVKVFLGDTTGQPITTVHTDPAGNSAWTEVAVPVVKPGEYQLIFQGADSTEQYVQRITVSALTPSLELSPWSGPPGSKLELNGRGFLAGESVKVYLGTSQDAVTTFQADQYGNYWGIGPLVVPTDVGGGKLTVRLVGQQSGAETTQTYAVVGVKPWAELSAYSGMPGTTVSFSGGGFAAKERITVHLGNASGPVVATAETDDNGNVIHSTATTADANALATTPTNITFTLVGESSKGEASAVFTAIPIVMPSPAMERPRPPQPNPPQPNH